LTQEKCYDYSPNIIIFKKKSTTSGVAYKGSSTISTPPARKKKASPRIVYGDNKKSAGTLPIHKNSDSDTEIVGAGESSSKENR